MRTYYRYNAFAIAGAVVIQAAAIAWGAFGIAHDSDNGMTITKDYTGNFGFELHAMMGTFVIPLLAISFLIAGIVAHKTAGCLKWSIVVFGLVALQVVLAGLAFAQPIIGVLHGTNALLILLSSIRASFIVRQPKATQAVSAPVSERETTSH